MKPSRVAADFSVELFDWNQLEQAKSLGVGNIDLARIEPFLASEQIVKLSSNKHGQRGQIRLRLVFQPEIIAKSRKATSTFSTAGRTMTSLGGLPVTAGKGVLSGVAGVFKQKENRQDDVFASIPAAQVAVASDGTQISATNFPSSENIASGTTGTLNLTVVEAKDLSQNDIRPYVTVRVGEKEFKTKHTQKTMSPEW
jgi:Ca2+-dependent lipid-binding protein